MKVLSVVWTCMLSAVMSATAYVKTVAVIFVCMLVSFTVVGCGSSSNTPVSQLIGADIIQEYSFHVEGEPAIFEATLPMEFNDANWGLKEIVCKEAGYTLLPYAGQTITLIRYSITDTIFAYNGPLYLWIIAKEQTSVCGYLTLRNSGAFPGIFTLNYPNIIYSGVSGVI